MAGKFEVYQDKSGNFRFRLKASNGEIILSSEGYSSKSACMNGIDSVKKNAINIERFQRISSSKSNYSFVLKASNHQVIGTGQSYKSDFDRDNAIKKVKENVKNSHVSDDVSSIDRSSSTFLTNDDTSINFLYLDNFRGFNNTLIPLKNVNFFVGENSTGKSSILGILKLLTTTNFWLNGPPKFESNEVQFGSGSFHDLVSVSSDNKTYFVLGQHDEDSANSSSRRANINTYLMAFIEKDGLPAISFYAYKYQGRAYFLRVGTKVSKFKVSDLPIDNNTEDIRGLFDRWMEIYKHDKSGYTQLPDKDLTASEIPLSYIPFALLNTVGEDLSPILSIRASISRDALIWLAPIRSKPKRTYDEYKLDFSPEGEHTPYLIKKLLGKRSEAINFEKFLNDLGSKSGLFDSITIQNYGKSLTSPFELDIVLNGKELSINNVGYGVSQALPIIVELFSRGRGTNYAVQQPEVHLHPRAQAALGDVFFSLATIEAKRFFIETHSDYTIDRYRANFRKDNIQTKPPSQILFFERNSSGNFIHPIKIDENGDISASQPDSYRDFFIREQMSNLGLES